MNLFIALAALVAGFMFWVKGGISYTSSYGVEIMRNGAFQDGKLY